jgi:hypothetical protein
MRCGDVHHCQRVGLFFGTNRLFTFSICVFLHSPTNGQAKASLLVVSRGQLSAKSSCPDSLEKYRQEWEKDNDYVCFPFRRRSPFFGSALLGADRTTMRFRLGNNHRGTLHKHPYGSTHQTLKNKSFPTADAVGVLSATTPSGRLFNVRLYLPP